MEKTVISDPEFYSVSELQKMLKVGRNNVYKLVNSYGFPMVTVGKRIIIPKDKFLLWLDQHSMKGKTNYVTE